MKLLAAGSWLLVAIRSGPSSKKWPGATIMKTQKVVIHTALFPNRVPPLHLLGLWFVFLTIVGQAGRVLWAWLGHVMRHALTFLFKSISFCTFSDGFKILPTAMLGAHLLLLFYFIFSAFCSWWFCKQVFGSPDNEPLTSQLLLFPDDPSRLALLLPANICYQSPPPLLHSTALHSSPDSARFLLSSDPFGGLFIIWLIN